MNNSRRWTSPLLVALALGAATLFNGCSDTERSSVRGLRAASPSSSATSTGDATPPPPRDLDASADATPPRPEGNKIAGTLAWFSGFENGFPGSNEWLDYQPSPPIFFADCTVPNGVQGWCNDSQGPVFSGNFAYRGRVIGAGGSGGVRRAYPVITTQAPHFNGGVRTPMVNTFMVYLDVDWADMNRSDDWISIATYTNNTDTINWPDLHGISIRERKIELAHSEPVFTGTYHGPSPQPEFPVGRWVRLTVYVHYRSDGTGIIHVWQDGAHVLSGGQVESGVPGGGDAKLTAAHWGLYTNDRAFSATLYNDDISLWSLNEPLSDFEKEPVVE